MTQGFETHRRIFKSAVTSRKVIQELITLMMVGELVSPGEDVWLVSPWITDVPLLDGHYTVTARISDRVDADLVARRVSHEGFSVLNPGVAHGVVSLGVGSVALS